MFKGLTREICQQAWDLVLPIVRHAADAGITNKLAGTIVVLNPDYDEDNDSSHEPVILFSAQIDPSLVNAAKYNEIALSKAQVTKRTRFPSSVVQQQYPYLYVEGDTKWGGSTILPGDIVIAFSGVQAVFDEMIAEMMAAAIKSLCRWEMVKPNGVMNSESAFLGES